MNIEDIPERIKGKLCEANRDINVYDDWWMCEVDCFKSDMEAIGIRVDKTYFSGFWSQGDGACFEGRVEDWGLFLSSLGYTDPFMLKIAAETWQHSCVHRGHYYHENCTSFDTYLYTPDDEEMVSIHLDIYEPLRVAVALTQLEQLDLDKLEKEFTEAFRNHMQDLYRRLEREYEYLTSDQAILEALESTGLLEDEVNNITLENEDA